jgi:hypothetical protein
MDPYFILVIEDVYFINIQNFVVLEFKRQHTQLSFILHLTFNKFETFPQALTLASNPPQRIYVLWAKVSFIQGGLSQSFIRCPSLLQFKHLIFDRSSLALFFDGSFTSSLFLLSFVGFTYLHLFWPFFFGLVFWVTPLATFLWWH